MKCLKPTQRLTQALLAITFLLITLAACRLADPPGAEPIPTSSPPATAMSPAVTAAPTASPASSTSVSQAQTAASTREPMPSSATPPAEDTVTPLIAAYQSITTGITAVDNIAAAVLAGDRLTLRASLLLREYACMEPVSPYVPACAEGEAEGTPIQLFTYSACEQLLTRDNAIISSLLDNLVVQATGVYAVYQTSATNYGIVFTTDSSRGITVFVADDLIDEIWFGCDQTPPEMLGAEGFTIILAPSTP